MSPDAKKLKIVSLVTMFAGITVAVVGIVLFADGFDLSDLFVLASGLVTMVLGGSGARVANVPSSAKGLVPQAGAVTAVDVAAATGSAFVVSGQIVAVVAAALVAVLAFALTLAAAGVKKGLERL